MHRTNIYLEERQIALLRRLGEQRDETVAEMVRAAVDDWLEAQGARQIPESEWERRFAQLLERRSQVTSDTDVDESEVARDVADAVAEVRATRLRRARGA